MSAPHWLRAHGTWEHTKLRAFRPKIKEAPKRRGQCIRSLGKQADWITVWGPKLKLVGSYPVQAMRGNATGLL